GRPVGSVNEYKNVLGIYPKGWRLPLVYRRDNVKHETLVRLMGVMPKDLQEGRQPRPRPRPRPDQPPRPGQPEVPKPSGPAPAESPALKLYKAKPGFANYYFNEQAQQRLLAAFARHGDFTALTGPWKLEGELDRKDKAKTSVKLEVVEQPV